MREILKARVFPLERQAHGADGPVTLLADDDFGNAFFGCLGVVHFIAVNKQNHIGVLFDRARFA